MKRLKLTKLQRDRAERISRIFNCFKFEPELCGLCSKIESFVSETRKI